MFKISNYSIAVTVKTEASKIYNLCVWVHIVNYKNVCKHTAKSGKIHINCQLGSSAEWSIKWELAVSLIYCSTVAFLPQILINFCFR